MTRRNEILLAGGFQPPYASSGAGTCPLPDTATPTVTATPVVSNTPTLTPAQSPVAGLLFQVALPAKTVPELESRSNSPAANKFAADLFE